MATTQMDMWVGIGYYIHNVAFKCNMWYSDGIVTKANASKIHICAQVRWLRVVSVWAKQVVLSYDLIF